MPPLPSDPDILRAMFREAGRYLEAMRPILQGLRALKQTDPYPPSDWDAMHRCHQLEALSRRLSDLSGLDLLWDRVDDPRQSLLTRGEEYAAVHRQACIEAGTEHTDSDTYC